jgi:hypothetical protein
VLEPETRSIQARAYPEFLVTNATLQQGLAPQAESALQSKLLDARMGLLDLSARNRLLNTPRSAKNARIIEIVDEKSAEVFRLLVTEERALTFAPGRASASSAVEGNESDSDEISELAQPEDETVDERGVLTRHADLKLQTRLTSKGLQKRLFEMHSDSVLLEQEQGVNILFLAIGMLKWIDPNNAKNIRYAPLMLVPVTLERGTAAERFKLKWRHEDQSSNLSLEAYLEQVHGLKMPIFETGDDCDPVGYARAVAETVALKAGWQVLPDDMVLGFFSFAKFLMYRDLDVECWPEQAPLTGNSLLRSLLGEGFSEPPLSIGEDASVDPYIAPVDMLHVADCDSSQMLAVHEVRQGHNLVIQGPPGTGKSQTIANIIASAVADGRTVLFVAEKMVALDVVKRRLDRCGVGDACLELHSNKTNKRVLLNELKRTWELGSPRGTLPEALSQNLENERDVLNLHATAMHREHPVARLTPFQVIGELASLLRQGGRSVDFELGDAPTWTSTDRELRRRLVEEFAFRIGEIGLPGRNPWRGVGLTGLLPTDVERLLRRVADLKREFDALATEANDLAARLHLPALQTLASLDAIRDMAELLDGAPELSQSALACAAWDHAAAEIMTLVNLGAEQSLLERRLDGRFRAELMETQVEEDRIKLASLGKLASWDEQAFDHLRRLENLLPELEEQASRLQLRLGIAEPAQTIGDIRRLARTGTAVAEAPDASPEAFASAVWNYGVEQAAEIAQASATLEEAKRNVGTLVGPAAWNMDLTSARGVLARHGDGLLRHFSGEWRAANKLVRGLLADAKLPIERMLPLLDALGRGREARSLMEQEDAFARQAFGPHWRGDRSSAAALGALVTWMRSLRGLGPEARMVAARLPDRKQFGPLAARIEQLLDEFSTLYDAIPPIVLPEPDSSGTLGELPLTQIRAALIPIVDAEARTRAIFSVVPVELTERLALLTELEELQEFQAKIRRSDELGSQCFGGHWAGRTSDWQKLHAAAVWLTDNKHLRLIAAELAGLPQRGAPLSRAARAVAARQRWLPAFSDLARDMKIDVSSSGAHAEVEGKDLYWADTVAVAELGERMQRWLDHPEALSKWMAFRECEGRIAGLSLAPLTERLCDGRISATDAVHAFAVAYYEALLREMLRLSPALSRFDGSAHARVVDRFVELDRSRIAASAIEVVQAHHRRIPAGGGVGPIGVLRGEIAKRSRHLPIRQLMQKAAPVVQALKPVMMMSPLSVAQFLPPGKLTFDLLVMDEASQIQPVDALGAIARCRQIVVVGDERQLPPTRFFAKMTSNVDDEREDEDEDTTDVADVESVLGLCSARGLPQRMLRWHYRSRHQSLIAVSNSEFYENKLSIFPSPFLPEAGMGLRFHHIAKGIFYPGKASAAPGATPGKGASAHQAANPVEALAVAEAVMRHALECPKLSIGVATFSMAQRRLIAEQIEELRRINPEAEKFFHSHPSEPFFVKNLENVQGDERDVILLSVGYGRDSEGKFAMRFGPLANDGGERRLNVLISRAKSRCEVYASITDEDIDIERAKSKGVFALKLFLHFARTGRLDMTKSVGPAEHKSVFISHLAAALRERGHLLHEQVGIAGCFIDLAVLSADMPGRYVLGIECDGPGYRSARSARDRDRLRRSVLEDHDWILYRVWSLDWLHRPQEQMASLEAAIERARVQLSEKCTDESVPNRYPALDLVTVEREDVTEMGLRAASREERIAVAYVEAAEARPSALELHDTPIAVLAELVERIVGIEGPLHVDELVVRVRSVWGLQRAGQRIQTAVERAIAAALTARKVERDGDFLKTPGAVVVPRDRSKVASLSLRRPEMLPPDEIDAAITSVLRNSFGATHDELIQICSRIFGYAATSTQLRTLFAGRIASLDQQGSIHLKGELFVIP